jgi:fluoroquinolone transport system permease protein
VRSLLTLLRWDLVMQYRHGFWASGLAVTVVWVLLLRPLPSPYLEFWLPCVLYTDIAVIGLMFIAGVLFFEKRQGVIDALVVTPVLTRDWLASKVLSLTLLATLMAAALILLTVGPDREWLWLIPACALAAGLDTLLGFLLAARFQSITGFLTAFGLLGVPLSLPVLDYLEIWSHPLLWLDPVQPTLVLVRQPIRPGGALEVVAALLLTALWIGAAFALGIRTFHHRVSWRRGAP